MIAPLSHCDLKDLGGQMYALAAELYPICRSVTGPGVRQTLERIGQIVPLVVHEVPTSTPLLDWKAPREWHIRDAYIADDTGLRIVDFKSSTLHVVGYSIPVHTRLGWSELKAHLHTLPDRPEWIPYRNSFAVEQWGFCLSHRQYLQLEALGERQYEIHIDSSLQFGSLTYGEVFLAGDVEEEVLISTHICHPSLANDNLSGIAVATYLARELQHRARRYSYRFLFVPATLGAIAWLARNRASAQRIKHGWVLAGVGDAGPPTYKASRRGNADVDRAFHQVLKHRDQPFSVEDFSPLGYDERQFCSPGFNLPMGCLMRTPHGRYPEYHTSADNLDFISPASLVDTWSICCEVVDVLEGNRRFLNRHPYGEPCLGPRGLYKAFGSSTAPRDLQSAVLWALNLCDGRHSLLDIAERAQLPFGLVQQAIQLLLMHDLVAAIDPSGSTPALENENVTSSLLVI